MEALEVETIHKVATNRHCHTEKFSGDTYLNEYLPEKYLWNHQALAGREEREREYATIRKKVQLIRYDQQAKQQCSTTTYKPTKRISCDILNHYTL